MANTLRHLRVDYTYEELLRMPDGTVREPDFTIRRLGRPTVYWEHLGVLDLSGYYADWRAKCTWYAEHGILPWHQGGGPSGSLVWSTEKQDTPGIDAHEIEQIALKVFDMDA